VELTNEFSVKGPVDEAWAVLTDLERVAPCMPGVELREIDGDEYRGVVKVKVGPMTAQYKGVASCRSSSCSPSCSGCSGASH
jgi:carbon monoxide dehydrogenase subunit G